MRNITDKIKTQRTARAKTSVSMSSETLKRLLANDVPKKDVLAIARAAGVMAAKNTPLMIPYCHTVPIHGVEINYTFLESQVVIESFVQSIWNTGLEMEAMLSASATALTIYDMLKPIDKGMQIEALVLSEKSGGKSDFIQSIPLDFKAAVLVTSDGTFAKKRDDKSGKIIVEKLKSLGIENISYTVLPDDMDQIADFLKLQCKEQVNLVLTTGGTGLGPRDVTVEATKKVIEREMPAVMDAIRTYGQERTPYAMLSRGLAGVCDKTVIVNFPGSSRGTTEGLNAVFPALLHVYKMMHGGGH